MLYTSQTRANKRCQSCHMGRDQLSGISSPSAADAGVQHKTYHIYCPPTTSFWSRMVEERLATVKMMLLLVVHFRTEAPKKFSEGELQGGSGHGRWVAGGQSPQGWGDRAGGGGAARSAVTAGAGLTPRGQCGHCRLPPGPARRHRPGCSGLSGLVGLYYR